MAISKGDTPETNPVSKIIVGWLDKLMAFGAAYSAVPVIPPDSDAE